jgi:hypothetical protein
LEQQARSTLFAPDLATARWTRDLLADGSVRFQIDSGNGLVLSKTFRHRPDQRGLGLELQLRNVGGAAVDGALHLDLRGPGLVNPGDSSLFGNPCVAIAQAAGGDPLWVGPKAGARQPLLQLDGQPWSMAGSTNRFFGAFLFPLDETAKAAVLNFAVLTGPTGDDRDSGTVANTVPRVLLGLKLAVPAAVAGTESRRLPGAEVVPGVDESPEHERFCRS